MTRTSLFVEAKVMSQPRVSGIGHTMQGLVRALQNSEAARERYRIRLLSPLDGVTRLRHLGMNNVEYVRLPLPTRGYDRWAGLPLLPPLDAFVGDGVFVFPHFGNWPLRRSASITFIHDVAFLRHPETVGGNLDLLTHNIGRWIARTSLVATVSRSSRDDITRYLGVAAERITVIPWGVDREVFRARGDAEVAELRDRLGLPDKYILYLGNIEPRKNLERLIAAYRRLPPRLRSEYALVLAGGLAWNSAGIERAITEAQAAGDRVSRVSEYVSDEDLPALLSGATMLAQPSLYEGFGVAPLQAMAVGIPVLVGDNSAQPEVAGDAGLYVDALDVADIERGMQTLLSDERLAAANVAAGLQRVQQFSWERSAGAMLEAVDRLAA
ncbi:MAG TPA: glycosyltransferase family 1 protein [Candidatus Acidoferrales bacterium]|jgi:alpha-1,3-rhamnosyl/mannosyltransferase|nr:glycosyltransferase family 1 protein [Candidatus Acidoferrales bacterium]